MIRFGDAIFETGERSPDDPTLVELVGELPFADVAGELPFEDGTGETVNPTLPVPTDGAN